jgi:hypothetical protein
MHLIHAISENNLSYYTVLCIGLMCIFGLLVYPAWANRASQWTTVATINGIVYYQHKKNQKKRTWGHVPVRSVINSDWLNGRTDVLLQ